MTRLVLASSLLLLVALGPLAHAQAPTPAPTPTPAPRAHARATLLSFQKAARGASRDPAQLELAATCFDLSDVPEEKRAAIGKERVQQLRAVLGQIKLLPIALVPNDPKGEPFVLYRHEGKAGELVLDRVGAEWKFTSETVQVLPKLFQILVAEREAAKAAAKTVAGTPTSKTAAAATTTTPDAAPEYEHVSDWIRSRMSHRLRGKAFLLEMWQWAGLGLLLLVGILLSRTITFLLVSAILGYFKRHQDLELDKALTRMSVRPFGLLAMAAFWWFGLGILGLHADVLRIASIAVRAVAAVAGVWGVYSLVDVIGNALERRAEESESKSDDLLVPLVRKTLKVFVVAFGLVFVADTLEFSVSSLLAGLGLGGLAFALAAQETVKNFFGSLTVVLDRPFEVGDWVVIGKVEGSVEEVGIRSTRIRTFYNSLITLPNATMLNATVDNMGKREYRRWTTKLGVTYDTDPDKLESLCEGIRELVRNHPYTRKDYFQVYVNDLSAHSIDILLYVFFETPDWTRELREKQRLILDILRVAKGLGVQIAYPTQTIHLVGDEAAAASPRSTEPASFAAAVRVPAPGAEAEDGKAAAQAVLADGGTTAYSAAILAEKLADSFEESEEKERKDRGDDDGEAGDSGGGGGEG